MMEINKRNSNIELLRIISMFMIVLSHYAYHGLIMNSVWSRGALFNQIVSSSCIVGDIGIGLFFAITGYFYVTKKTIPSLKKVIGIVLFYAFFSILVIGVGIFIGEVVGMSKHDLIFLSVKSLFIPVTGGVWWFVSAYVVLIVLCPHINHIMNMVGKKGFLFVITLFGIFDYLLGGVLGGSLNDLEKAIFFYLIGAYTRQFANEKKILNGKIILVLVAFMAMHSVARFCSFYLSPNWKFLFLIITSISVPFIVFSLLFLFAKSNAKQINFVNTLASFTFGVYLFHDAPFTRKILWHVLIKPENTFFSDLFIPTMFVSVILVFATGCIIDLFRQKFFEQKILYMEKSIVDFFRNKFISSVDKIADK